MPVAAIPAEKPPDSTGASAPAWPDGGSEPCPHRPPSSPERHPPRHPIPPRPPRCTSGPPAHSPRRGASCGGFRGAVFCQFQPSRCRNRLPAEWRVHDTSAQCDGPNPAFPLRPGGGKASARLPECSASPGAPNVAGPSRTRPGNPANREEKPANPADGRSDPDNPRSRLNPATSTPGGYPGWE